MIMKTYVDNISTALCMYMYCCAMQRDSNLPAGSSLRQRLEGCEGCSSSVAAALGPTEPPARPEGTASWWTLGQNIFKKMWPPLVLVNVAVLERSLLHE